MNERDLKVLNKIKNMFKYTPYSRKGWYDIIYGFEGGYTAEQVNQMLDEYEKKMGLTKTPE